MLRNLSTLAGDEWVKIRADLMQSGQFLEQWESGRSQEIGGAGKIGKFLRFLENSGNFASVTNDDVDW